MVLAGVFAKRMDGRPKSLHSGSLASSRASMRINLDNGRYGIIFYTLANPAQSGEITRQLNRALIQMVGQ